MDGLCLPHLNDLRFILIELFNVFRRTCPSERLFSSGSMDAHGQLQPYIEVAVVQPHAPQKRFGTLSLDIRLCGESEPFKFHGVQVSKCSNCF